MKRISTLVPSLVFLIILMFTVFAKADYILLSEDEALLIGEEKYLEFLWMIDGAFNNSKFNEEFVVNGKKLDNNKKKFVCNYKDKKSTSCISKNFEEEFARIFSSKISYDEVYGDGVIYTWYKYENGKYSFNMLNNCNISRMDTSQSIRVNEIYSDKLTFYVNENNNTEKNRTFVLIKEDNNWKISEAYYRDICEMDYNIG